MQPIIDYWCNPFTADYTEKVYTTDEFKKLISWWKMEEQFKPRTIQSYVEEMDKNGVVKAIIPTFKMKSYQKKVMLADVSISDVMKYKEQAPEHFELLYGINPETKMEGVRELQLAVNQYGFIGAHLHTYGFGLPLNDRIYYPFYAKCAELDIPVVMQVGHSAESMPNELGRPLLVDTLALDFPELRIVCSHTGWPWVEEMVAVAWKHPNVYMGTAAHHPKYYDPSVVAFLKTRGLGKTLYGTDYPVITYESSLKTINEWDTRPGVKESLLHDVAKKVFKL